MEGLKAACLSLAQEALKPPNLFNKNSSVVTDNLERILFTLQYTPEIITPEVSEYIFFPLKTLLQQNELGLRQSELLMRTIGQLAHSAWAEEDAFELERAHQLVSVIAYLLSPEPPNLSEGNEALRPSKQFLSKPPSFHAAGFGALDEIFQAAWINGFSILLGQSPAIAQIISMLLDGIQYDSEDREAQTAAINALHTIIARVIGIPDHLALVLPRIVSRLTRFIAPANKRHYTAKAKAILCLADLIMGTMSSASFTGETNVRTDKWIDDTSTHLNDSFSVMQRLQFTLHDSRAPRPELLLSLYSFASYVHAKCTVTFQKAKVGESMEETLLKMILFSATQRTIHDLSEDAGAFLSQAEIQKSLQKIVAKQITTLPGVIESPDEETSEVTLRTLQKAVSYASGDDTAMTLIDTIEGALPLSARKNSRDSAPRVSLVKEIAPFSRQNGAKVLLLSDIGLQLPVGKSIQLQIANILREIGHKNGVMQNLVERLQALRMRGRGTLNAVSLLWISSCVLRGLPSGSDTYDLVTYCYEELSDSLSLHASDTNQVGPAARAHTALACYVLGEAALLQGSAFNDYLVDLIHPLFSMLGNSASMSVQRQAQAAIGKVAHACGYATPVELAIANKDYLIDGISFQLNTLDFTPDTLTALASLVYVSGPQVLPYLDDVFSSLFILMDHYHDYFLLVKGILTVFGSLIFTLRISTHMPDLVKSKQSESTIPDFSSLLSELKRPPVVDPSLAEHSGSLSEWEKEHARKTSSEDAELEKSGENDEPGLDDADAAVENWEYPIGKSTYHMIEKIAAYCDRLMTHERAEIRTATLTLVTELIPYLAVNSEHFLPLVHKTWPEVVERAFDTETYVVEQSFASLSMFSHYATEFITTRVDDLWPRLKKAYSRLLERPWPEFSPERRIIASLAKFLVAIVTDIQNVSLATLESIVVTFREAFLRQEFMDLCDGIAASPNRSGADTLWLVLLQSAFQPVTPDQQVVHPVYSQRYST